MNDKEILRTENLVKKYRKQIALDNINFSLDSGEIVGLVGPNGAGKSTLMSILCGLINNYSGSVYLNGENIRNTKKTKEKLIGSMIETPGFYPNLTGYQNLEFFAELSGNNARKEIDKIVEMVGLSDAINKKVKKYSLGMKQRLGIAQAVLGYPKILVLDEPTNGLDPNVIPEIRKFIKHIAKEKNISVIISSHILTEIEAICERVVFIQKGKIIKEIKIDEDKDSINNMFVIESNNLDKLKEFLKEKNIQVSPNNNNSLRVEIDNQEVEILISEIIKEGIMIKSVYEYKQTLEDKFLETMEEDSIV